MEALPYAIPAAAASLAYLNARYGFSYDWRVLSSLMKTIVYGSRRDRQDNWNLFYEFESHARSFRANHTFVIFEGQRWSYKQAYENVLRYGTWLRSKGVRKDEIVAIDFVNSEKFIWIWFGLWSIGAKPAFINYNLPGKSLVHTIKTSTARLVIVDQEGKEKFNDEVMKEHGFVPAVTNRGREAKYGFEVEQSEIPTSLRNRSVVLQAANEAGVVAEPLTPHHQLEIVCFSDELAAHVLTCPPARPPDSARANQKRAGMAMLIYTSGTTGLPKAAVVSWAKCVLGSKFASGWLNLKNEIMYTSMPLYHSAASILGVCSTLHAGSTLAISKKFSHKKFWPEVIDSEATILHYVGETCRYLLSAPPSSIDKKHKIHSAFGNGLRPDVWNPFKERFGIQTIYEMYAATESPGSFWNRSTNSFSAGAIGRNGSIMSLITNPSLAVVRIDPASDPPEPLRNSSTDLCQLCVWNEPGEVLYALDPNDTNDQFQGYFGNNKATDSKILRNVKKQGDAYFRTGDIMRADKGGRWWFVDRTGDTFRWKAENVSTTEVSEALGRHDAVIEANVYGVQVPQHDGRAGCAAIVLKPDLLSSSPDSPTSLPSAQILRSLAAHVNKELPAFAVPIWLRFTSEMHITGTNKQQKTSLQAEGINLRKVAEHGDVLYWLNGDTYEKFTKRHLDRIESGSVKL